MKKALSVSLLGIVVAFSVACDNGQKFDIPEDSKVFISIEREITVEKNALLKVFASDFNLNRDTQNNVLLMFTCPCYLGWNRWDDFSSVVEVNDQQVISVKLLPGAAYNVWERRLESGEERSYRFPMK